ncbi:MAG: SMI1/KNR4 family protein [Muribaculaceae bacterium]|nr:SMI1/KNR4 family protein [Alistipes senegalensis]MCM1474009.1 SMI1/KNR4 family protein [Muribaculaceae bacterium]
MKYNINNPEAVAIREKMERLKKFGDVEIYDTISIEEVRKFEDENNIKLPEDYLWFITNVANGCKSSGVHDYRYNCGFYPLEKTYFSDEDIGNYCEGEEDFSIDISSKGCSYSYGIILKGEHYGEISDNADGLAYYYPKKVHGFKEWYNTLLDETLLGYDTLRFDERISGKIEDILDSYRQNHDMFYIRSVQWKVGWDCKKDVITKKLMNDIYKIFVNETIPENKKVLFYILENIGYPDMFSVIEQIFIPENYETIVFSLNTTGGIYFKGRNFKNGVIDGAGRYYPMIRKMLDYLSENESEYFRYAFRIAVMNPKFKASHIENISNRDFVMKHISGLYEDELKKRTEPYYTQAKK